MQSLSEQYPQVAPISACIFCDWPATYKEGRTSQSVSGELADLSSESQSRFPPLAKEHSQIMSVGLQGQKRAYRQRRKDPSCDACRERKVKCDATDSLSCTKCLSRNMKCQFTKETYRRMLNIRHNQDLQKELAQARSQVSHLRSIELPTACPVVPIEQFQNHVGHHLEQLALFALPPPIKESSQTSSNHVAMSHPSRRSDEESVSKTSGQSSTPDYSDPLPELYLALTHGDIDLVKKLLQGGADANVRSPQGAGLLQVAAVFGVLEALEILLDAGTDPNAQGGEYGNALQAIAAYDGQKLGALRLLLGAGADVNMKGGKFGHALVAAAATELHPGIEVSEPTCKVIQVLLEFGADVNADGWMYENALGASIARKDYDSVRILLEHGADINAQGGHHGTALQAASAKGYEQVVRLLLDQGADINALDKNSGTALQAASAKGHKQVVQMLLEWGADPNPIRAYESRFLPG